MMERFTNWLSQCDVVLLEIFKVARFAMAILVVLIVDALGIMKLWVILAGR
jgi:hypothetical protein